MIISIKLNSVDFDFITIDLSKIVAYAQRKIVNQTRNTYFVSVFYIGSEKPIEFSTDVNFDEEAKKRL